MFNPIGSQAKHLLDTINHGRVQRVSDIRSDNRADFKADMEYIKQRITADGSGLRGDYKTDTSIQAKDLELINNFDLET